MTRNTAREERLARELADELWQRGLVPLIPAQAPTVLDRVLHHPVWTSYAAVVESFLGTIGATAAPVRAATRRGCGGTHTEVCWVPHWLADLSELHAILGGPPPAWRARFDACASGKEARTAVRAELDELRSAAAAVHALGGVSDVAAWLAARRQEGGEPRGG